MTLALFSLAFSKRTTKNIMIQTRNKIVCLDEDWKFIGKQTVVKIYYKTFHVATFFEKKGYLVGPCKFPYNNNSFEEHKSIIDVWRDTAKKQGPMSDAIRKLIGRDNAIKGKNETRN